MRKTRKRQLFCSFVVVLVPSFSVVTWPTAVAWAADPPTQAAIQDAGRHFHRGVALFNEADYAGALAEFRRAYEIAPNAAVLYNIAQTHFQLRSYAAALQNFEKYLADSGPNPEHKVDAETAIETLRTRVGKIDITAPDGAEISIDDEVVGKAPLPPVLAAVGKRKLIATKDGRPSAPRFVEVSAGETIKADIKMDTSSSSGTGPTPNGPVGGDKPVEKSSSALPTILWIGAAALAAGAVTTGILTMGAANDLSDARKKFPSSRSELDDLSDKTKTLALVTDILGAGAIVAGGVALYLTLSGPSSSSGRANPSPIDNKNTAVSNVRVRLAPTGAILSGSF